MSTNLETTLNKLCEKKIEEIVLYLAGDKDIYKIFRLESTLLFLEGEFKNFREAAIRDFDLYGDKCSQKLLHKIILRQMKCAITTIMSFK